MSCEKQGGPYGRLSLIDGSLEPVHFRPVEEILREAVDRRLSSFKVNPETKQEIDRSGIDPLGR